MIKTMTDDNFREILSDKVLDHPKIAIVKVAATWCGPCKLLKPHYERWADNHKNEDDVVFYEIDNDLNPEFVKEYEIGALPSILFFVYGVETYSIRSMTRGSVFEEVLQKTREIETEVK